MITSAHSILDATQINDKTIMYVGVDDVRMSEGEKHGLVWRQTADKWSDIEIGEKLVSCISTTHQQYRFVAVAETGRELVIGESNVQQELVAVGAHSPASNGPLTKLRCFDGTDVYAVGTARQVYRKTSVDRWQRIDQSCKSDDPEVRSSSAFLDIDRFSETEFYAVGWEGEIWTFDGAIWKRLDSPTNLILHSLCCAPDGYVYICGQNGLILKGRHDEWAIIGQVPTEESLRSICWFKQHLYTCTSNVAYTITTRGEFDDADSIINVGSTGKLKCNDDNLLSVGLKDVRMFDGTSWRVLV